METYGIALFYNTKDAMQAEAEAKRRQLKARIVPTPGKNLRQLRIFPALRPGGGRVADGDAGAMRLFLRELVSCRAGRIEGVL